MKRSSLALVAITLLAIVGTSLYSQGQSQNEAPRPARSRADETLDMWNEIGNKLVAGAKHFSEDKYDFKLQTDQRSFAQKSSTRRRSRLRPDALGFRIKHRARLRQEQAQPVARRLQDESRRGEALSSSMN